MNARRALATAVSLAAALCTACAAFAQGYPARPVRLVVPFPPSGAVDIVGRLVAAPLAERLGQQIVIDNRAGANGIIGTEIVARATPDGYTLLIVPAGHAINPSVSRKLPFDAVEDFASVGLVGNGSYLLVGNPGVPAKTVPEAAALVKAQPGRIVFASSGVGNATHLSAELFAAMAGGKVVHVPYKGSAPALTDLMSGQVQFFFATIASSIGHVRAGKLRAFGVTTLRRSAAAPDIPTIAESGLPGYEVDGWYALFAPRGTPAATIDRLNRDLGAGLATRDLRERLMAAGIEARASTPAELTDILRKDIDKWAKLIRSAGIRLE